MQFRLYHHLFEVPGARGWLIVGTHHLVVEPSREPLPSLAWLLIAFGIIRSGFPAVHPVTIRSVQIAFCKSSRLPTASDVMNVLVIAAIMASFMILKFVQIQLGHL